MTRRYRTFLTFAAAMAVALPTVLAPATVVAVACDKRIVVDSVEYFVDDYWCERELDSSQIAAPENLVQLPQELTFEDYRIYVLPKTRDAFVAMADAARKDGVDLRADSGFRSLGFQRRLLKRRLEKGESFETILRSVAPPGYSEHHTGLALDLCPSDPIFVKDTAYAWLQKNAARFGFRETMPEDSTSRMHWEPWHWMYVGH